MYAFEIVYASGKLRNVFFLLFAVSEIFTRVLEASDSHVQLSDIKKVCDDHNIPHALLVFRPLYSIPVC